MLISAVVVSYRSGELALRAIESFRAGAAAVGLELEAIAVVNSGDEDEARALAPAVDRVITPGRNLGFAGGLNRGLAAASGEVLALANPDILLRRGAFSALVEEALRGPVAAGPVYFWDDGETLRLPPSEEPRPNELVRRRLANAGAGSVFRRDLARARREDARIANGATFTATSLWGALVVTTRKTLRTAGPFDEGYPLYYEEHDWQRRLRLTGGELRRVGAARVVHRFNQSARKEPRAAGWFAISERRYFTSHFGEQGLRALDLLQEPTPPAPSPNALDVPRGGEALTIPGDAAAVVVSPFPQFKPFAYAPLPHGARAWSFPPDVRLGIEGPWFARAVDADGRVVAEGRLGPF